MSKRDQKIMYPARHDSWFMIPRSTAPLISSDNVILSGHRRTRAAEHFLSEPMILEEVPDNPVDSPDS